MGRAVYTEKGSCRHCVDNGLMERELMCSVCQEHAQYSDRSLRRMEEQGDFSIKGVCHHLHGPLSQPTVDRRAAANSPSRRRSRKRAAADNMERGRFVPTQERKTSGQKQKPTKQEEQRKALETLGMNTNQINFNKGGKSRSRCELQGKGFNWHRDQCRSRQC